MTARQIIVPGAMPSRDANGRNLPAKFRFYAPATALTTPAVVYTDVTLSVPHPFPILSDSAGRWPQIWADEAASFDVGWTDQVYDKTIGGPFLDVSPADDATLASVDLADAAAEAAQAAADEAAAQAHAAAASAVVAAAAAAGLNVKATSSTPFTITSPATKVFTLDQAGTDFAIGMDVGIASEANPAVNRVVATVTSFADPLLTVSIPAGGASGSGLHSDWSIALTSIGGVVSVAALTGIITAAALKAALAISPADVVGFSDAVDDEAVAMAVAFF